MNDKPQTPLKWLLNELSAVLSADQYVSLMEDYEVVKRRYDTASKLRQAQGDLVRYRRNQELADPSRHQIYAKIIERKLKRIRQLEQEISEL